MNKPVIISGCIVFFVVLLTGVILFALSFHVVEVNEYGLVYNHAS